MFPQSASVTPVVVAVSAGLLRILIHFIATVIFVIVVNSSIQIGRVIIIDTGGQIGIKCGNRFVLVVTQVSVLIVVITVGGVELGCRPASSLSAPAERIVVHTSFRCPFLHVLDVLFHSWVSG